MILKKPDIFYKYLKKREAQCFVSELKQKLICTMFRLHYE